MKATEAINSTATAGSTLSATAVTAAYATAAADPLQGNDYVCSLTSVWIYYKIYPEPLALGLRLYFTVYTFSRHNTVLLLSLPSDSGQKHMCLKNRLSFAYSKTAAV